MALGKQVGTYLKGQTAVQFDELVTERKSTTYALLTEAVEDLLIKEGRMEARKPKGRIVPIEELAETQGIPMPSRLVRRTRTR